MRWGSIDDSELGNATEKIGGRPDNHHHHHIILDHDNLDDKFDLNYKNYYEDNDGDDNDG